jgi:hypothetical protein
MCQKCISIPSPYLTPVLTVTILPLSFHWVNISEWEDTFFFFFFFYYDYDYYYYMMATRHATKQFLLSVAVFGFFFFVAWLINIHTHTECSHQRLSVHCKVDVTFIADGKKIEKKIQLWNFSFLSARKKFNENIFFWKFS